MKLLVSLTLSAVVSLYEACHALVEATRKASLEAIHLE